MFEKLANETILEIFESLDSFEDQVNLSKTQRRFNQLFKMIKPKIIFYRTIERSVETFEFVKYERKPTFDLITFDPKYTKCKCLDQCKSRHKPVKRKIKRVSTDMLSIKKGTPYCKSPNSSHDIFAITERKLENVLKSICDRCRMLENCENCCIMNGCCGISMCQYNIPVIFHDVLLFNGHSQIHSHNICERCFIQIPKNTWINLSINNQFQ